MPKTFLTYNCMFMFPLLKLFMFLVYTVPRVLYVLSKLFLVRFRIKLRQTKVRFQLRGPTFGRKVEHWRI